MKHQSGKKACVSAVLAILSLVFCSLGAPLWAMESRAEEAPAPIVVTLEPGRTDTSIDLFLNAYDGTVLSDKTVIAPGTENTVTVRFYEPHGAAFSYRVYLKTEVLREGKPSETELPLMLSAEGGSYEKFAGWRSEGDGILVSSGTLPAGEDGYLSLNWKWAFERGDDAGDVDLSDIEGLSAIVRIVVITEADEPTAPPTKAPESGTTAGPTRAPSNTPRNNTPFGVDDSPVGIIVILVLAGITGALLIIIHRHKKTRNE